MAHIFEDVELRVEGLGFRVEGYYKYERFSRCKTIPTEFLRETPIMILQSEE